MNEVKRRGRPPNQTAKNEVLTDEANQTDQTEGVAMQEAKQEEVIAPKKRGTRPGWKPSSQLPNLKAPHGFTAKWCNPAKLTERRSEGWIIMTPKDNKGSEIMSVDVNDGGSLTDALRYRDLVAIMLPNELKADRDAWLKNENEEAMAGILKKTDEELKQHGVETYTPKGQAGRIVID